MPTNIIPWDELVEQEDVLILDTETTGRGQRAEIIDIAMIDTIGNERFESLCKPERPIPITAMRVHKITDRMVANAETWVDIHKTVEKLFEQAEYVLAWNADFDERMLRQTAERYELEWKYKTNSMTCCVITGNCDLTGWDTVCRKPVAMKAYRGMKARHTVRWLTVIVSLRLCGRM